MMTSHGGSAGPSKEERRMQHAGEVLVYWQAWSRPESFGFVPRNGTDLDKSYSVLLLALLVHDLNKFVQICYHCLEPAQLSNTFSVFLNEPVGTMRELVRGAVLGNVLHVLALTATSHQVQNLVPDQLERITVCPSRALVIPASFGCAIYSYIIYSVTLWYNLSLIWCISTLYGVGISIAIVISR